ncbi:MULTISPECIES: hypothetical protein [unclassified Roseateles]|uniref:hypothetical protein n=1 Tax=unclassified Roseateles TaxID=2626991 RepID=UPI0006FAB1CC|nr:MULTISPECIES: hypothetical protein [unclassified Roseateles]KQW49982.1 hypothetical protein ASC81_24610 [Pelomonas sp. Root405]KRA67382.1 hypothetical protein ASD88_24610 [Pelomonas sp. Root662]
MNLMLTEAHWKSKGLPLRTTKEKLTQSKTGISEALRVLAATDKLLRAEILNESLVKKMDTVLKASEAALKKLKAEDKKLLALRDNMVKELADYRKDHNTLVNQIARDNIGAVSGGIKMLRAQAKKEFSSENQDFVEGAAKVANADAMKIMGYIATIDVGSLNISNASRWKALVDERLQWEKDVKLALKTSMLEIRKIQGDTIDRLKATCQL